MATVTDVVTQVIKELSQVPGVGTQLYVTDKVTQFVEDTMLLLIEETWWPQLMEFFQATLDGTTGLLTADLTGTISSITKFSDIRKVWPSDSNLPLSILPPTLNPFTLDGSGPRFISADATYTNRPIKVWPITSTGSVVIHARQRPATPVTGTDTIYMDQTLLAYGAAWMYCVDDGTVPAQIAKFENLFETRRKQMIAAMNIHPIELTPTDAINTDSWWEIS